MKHFKTAIIATMITSTLVLAVGAFGVYQILQADESDALKDARAEKLGQVVGASAVLISFPFWFYGFRRWKEARQLCRKTNEDAD